MQNVSYISTVNKFSQQKTDLLMVIKLDILLILVLCTNSLKITKKPKINTGLQELRVKNYIKITFILRNMKKIKAEKELNITA